MADSYFDPSFDLGPVCVYEAEGVLSDLSPVNSEKISLAAYPYMRKPEDFRLDVCYRNGMRPTAEDFRSFCHNAGCSVSHRNGNIADTLEPWNVTTGVWKRSGTYRKQLLTKGMRPVRPGSSCKDCWTPLRCPRTPLGRKDTG